VLRPGKVESERRPNDRPLAFGIHHRHEANPDSIIKPLDTPVLMRCDIVIPVGHSISMIMNRLPDAFGIEKPAAEPPDLPIVLENQSLDGADLSPNLDSRLPGIRGSLRMAAMRRRPQV
jgi:hypothetical protein